MTPPLIGLNLMLEPDDSGGMSCLRPSYWESVAAAGGVPVLVPPLADPIALEAALAPLAGFVMIGGDDLPGERFGQPTLPTAVTLDPRRDAADALLLERLQARRLPLLAICLACQQLNVARGGTLYQDLPFDGPPGSAVRHLTRTGGRAPCHPLRLAPGSLLARLWDGAAEATVNSVHHQGIRALGRGLRPAAWAPDSLVEAFEAEDQPFCLGVQWHPERMPDDPRQRKLFEALVMHALDYQHGA